MCFAINWWTIRSNFPLYTSTTIQFIVFSSILDFYFILFYLRFVNGIRFKLYNSLEFYIYFIIITCLQPSVIILIMFSVIWSLCFMFYWFNWALQNLPFFHLDYQTFLLKKRKKFIKLSFVSMFKLCIMIYWRDKSANLLSFCENHINP